MKSRDRTMTGWKHLHSTLAAGSFLALLAGCETSDNPSEPSPTAIQGAPSAAQQGVGAQPKQAAAPDELAQRPEPGSAQPGSPQPTTAPTGAGEEQGGAGAADDISDRDIGLFADALVKVTELRGMVKNQVQNADSKEHVEALHQAAAERKSEILKEVGIAPETYAAISQQVTKDPKLQARVTKALDSRVQ